VSTLSALLAFVSCLLADLAVSARHRTNVPPAKRWVIQRFSAAKVKSNIKMLAENRVEPHPAAKPRNIQLPRLEKSGFATLKQHGSEGRNGLPGDGLYCLTSLSEATRN